jgi:hypothetical protein
MKLRSHNEARDLLSLALLLFLLTLFVPLLTNCASWRQTTLVALDGAGRTAALAPALMAEKCDATMEVCRKENRTTPVDCPELERCHRDEKTVAKAGLTAQVWVLAGIKAVEVADKPGAKEILAKVIEIVGPIERVLLAWGVKL